MPGRFILEEMGERLFSCFSNKGEMELPHPNFAVSDLIHIVNKKTPRVFWPMGLIEEVFPDINGYVSSPELMNSINW